MWGRVVACPGPVEESLALALLIETVKAVLEVHSLCLVTAVVVLPSSVLHPVCRPRELAPPISSIILPSPTTQF